MTRTDLSPRWSPIAAVCVALVALSPKYARSQAPATAPPTQVRESWDAIYLGSSKIGYTHVKVEPVTDRNGKELVRVRFETELTFKRGRDRVQMSLLYGTIETQDGSVLRLDTRTQASDNLIRTYGDVIDNVMKLKLSSGGQEQQKDIPWDTDVRGPYGAEISLVKEPIKPGESRVVKTFIPDLNKVCLSKLVAKDMEAIEIGRKGAERKLLRVEQTVSETDGKPIPSMASTLWVDEGGQILKSRTDLLGGVNIYRTTRDGALAPDGDFDLLSSSIIKSRYKLPTPERTRNVVYRITVEGDDPSQIFPNDRRQTVTPEKSATAGLGSALIEVKTTGPNVGEADSAKEIEPEYLRPNPLVNSEDARVLGLMSKAVAGRKDPWEKAAAIQTWVFSNIKRKNFNTAFAPAEEVAKNLTGDCSEHSVLTAAMCRAAGIPARCVVGLVYVAHLGGFGPHMWNEVFVNGRWVAIDSAFNQSEVDATHLKLSETSLDGVAPFEAFLPVLRVFAKMKIEPVEMR